MKISVHTEAATDILGPADGIRAIKEAGFEAIDLGVYMFFPQKEVMDEEYLRFLLDEKRLRGIIDPIKEQTKLCGLTIDQIHAPATYIPRKPRETQIMRACLNRSIAICEELGCSRMVVHPCTDNSARYPSLTKKQEYEENISFFSSIIPLLKKHGVMCCIENAYSIDWGTKKAYAAACSDANETCAYIDKLNEIAGEKCFGACLDTGHLTILGNDSANAVRTLGSRLEVLHLHDNNGYTDDHTAPFLGICNWSRFIDALRDVGYSGNLNFETCFFNLKFPKELVPSALKFIGATANWFREKITK